MASNQLVKKNQHKLLIYEALFAICSWIIISLIILIPTYNILVKQQKNSLDYLKNISSNYLENYFYNLTDIASQIASQTEGKQLLIKWQNPNVVDKNNIILALTNILKDSLQSDNDIQYIARIDDKHNLLAEYGDNIIEDLDLKNLTAHNKLAILSPITKENNAYIPIINPILDINNKIIGVDIIIFKANNLQEKITELTKTDYNTQIILGYIKNNKLELLQKNKFNLLANLNQVNIFLNSITDDKPENEIHIEEHELFISYKKHKNTNWIAVMIAKTEGLQTYKKNNLLVMLIFCLMAIVIMLPVFWIFVLRPFAKQILIHTESLDKKNRAETARLFKIIKQLRESSKKDQLTSLYNRKALSDFFATYKSLAKRNNERIAVMFLDLDGFKNINDSYGHDVGDKILQRIASELNLNTRTSDIVARIGGDEFAILLYSFTSKEDIVVIADKIIEKLSSINNFGKLEIKLGISIGIVTYPNDGATCDELLSSADYAMYAAKDNGGNRYYFFSDLDTNDLKANSMK